MRLKPMSAASGTSSEKPRFSARGWLVLAGCATAIATAALAGAVVLVDGRMLRPYAAFAASHALGLQVEIGALTLRKGRILGVDAQDIVVLNPAWAEGEAARIGAFSVDVDLVSLIWGPTRLMGFTVEGAEIDLAVSAAHGVNWSPSAPTLEALLPEDRPDVTEIGDVTLTAVTLAYRDLDAGTVRTLAIATATGAAVSGEHVRLEGDGALDGAPVRFAAGGGSYDALVAASAPYEFSIGVDGETSIAVDGALGAGADFRIVGATLTASGPDMSLLTPIVGAPFPATPPYTLSGEIRRDGAAAGLHGIKGTFGGSDVAGWVSVDAGKERARITGALTSRNLDFKDLAGLIGGASDPDEAAKAGLLPDKAPPVAALRRVDIDMTYEAASVSAPGAKVEGLSARIVLDAGRLLVAPLSLAIAGGSASGEIALNVRQDTPSADIELAFENIDVKPYFEDTSLVRHMAGPLSGRLYLLGVGETFADIVTNARGGGHLVMRDGLISGKLVEAIGLDLTESLGLLLHGDVSLPVACAAAAVTVDGSTYRIEKAMASTSDSTLLARGVVNLAAQTLDIELEALAKDFSLIDYTSPVSIKGPLANPDVTIAELDLLPFFELGAEVSPSCDVIIAAARRAGPGKP